MNESLSETEYKEDVCYHNRLVREQLRMPWHVFQSTYTAMTRLRELRAAYTIIMYEKDYGDIFDGMFDEECRILDELDRVKDRGAISSLAELAKNTATNRPNITLILVGVADTADSLLAGHGSNFRNLREVPLGRMEEPELLAILNRGERVLGIKFSDDVTRAMIELCDRMPYYLHLLATNAAREALQLRAPIVELDDLARGSRRAAREADQQLRDTYEHATLSQKGSSIYKRITWAIANLPKKDNNVADITRETNKIAIDANDETVTPQAIGAALKRLASAEKRNILHHPIPGVYRFTNPLMKGFIRLVRHGL